MNALGLISGGKDSVLACHVAAAVWGVQIVAVGHLKPRGRADETDSYMFQSVGSDAVDVLGRCGFAPAEYFAAELTGGSVNVDAEYSPTPADEIEDLLEFLSSAQQRLAARGVQLHAVVTGAIWSRYQKRRVEYVCNKLGLKSLAPLFAFDQVMYLSILRKLSPEFDCRIIKTACLGLDRSHLLKSFADDAFVRHLMKLQRMYDVNVGGEGGEYETLTLRAPGFADEFAIVHAEQVATSDVSYAKLTVAAAGAAASGGAFDTTFETRVMQSRFFQRLREAWRTGRLVAGEAGFELAELESRGWLGPAVASASCVAGSAPNVLVSCGIPIEVHSTIEHNESESIQYSAIGRVGAAEVGGVIRIADATYIEGSVPEQMGLMVLGALRSWLNLSISALGDRWAQYAREVAEVTVVVPEAFAGVEELIREFLVRNWTQSAQMHRTRWCERVRKLGFGTCLNCLQEECQCAPVAVAEPDCVRPAVQLLVRGSPTRVCVWTR